MTASMLRLAHRGDWRVAPENTIAAFEAGMRVPGCDGIELDVRLSRDGVPVVLHDESLARVQQRTGTVGELDAADLGAAGVPSLAAVLAAMGRAWLDVELKGADHGDATAAVLRAARGDAPTNAVVSSFDPPSLDAIAERLPGWGRWLNATSLDRPTLGLAKELGCRAVAVLWGAITPASIRLAHTQGLEVAAWTIRRVDTRDRLERLGVVACCVEAAALGPVS